MSYVRTQNVPEIWADWLVCAVHYEPDRHGRIASVRVRKDLGTSVGAEVWEMTREDVLARLARGETFATIYMVNEKWRYGAPVLAEQHGGTGLGGSYFYYLRTVADGVRLDNLGQLPTY